VDATVAQGLSTEVVPRLRVVVDEGRTREKLGVVDHFEGAKG